jgi:transcriptional regulator with XRE-family HTH domain
MFFKGSNLGKSLDNHTERMLDVVSANVKKYRKLKKQSQLSLALEIGMNSSSFFGRAEMRKTGHHFSIKHLVKISKILKVPVSVFFVPINEPVNEAE